MLSLQHGYVRTVFRSWQWWIATVAIIVLVGAAVDSHSVYAQPTKPQMVHVNPNRPVLAFYYGWYTQPDWCTCHMSDLPAQQYNSADSNAIDSQLNEASQAGITGFISSWWGQGDQTDSNLQHLLDRSAALQQRIGYRFTSTIYFESDSPHLQGEAAMVSGLRYVIANYTASPYFLYWHGKPVIFIWDPLGHGRTLSLWASVLHQVDPYHHILWSAEGLSMSLLSVFDGIHLFSAGYWGLLNGNMAAVDREFSDKVANYNATYGTHKIWAAGVMPGYDDTRVPGRTGAFRVPRYNGATYRTSWSAAIASNPAWITITSFNEWFEGSMIEPATDYGTTYLDITQYYTRSWYW